MVNFMLRIVYHNKKNIFKDADWGSCLTLTLTL